MRNGLRTALICLLAVTIHWSPLLQQHVQGCPFCDAPSTTLTEQLATSHIAVLARWKSADRPDANNFEEGTTTYEVIHAAGPGVAEFPRGKEFTISRYQSGEPGDEALYFAQKNENSLAWGLPSLCSRECWQYLVTAPPRTLPAGERLPFFLGMLEHSDPDIAMDAYAEFAGINYEDLQRISSLFSREKLVGWLTDPLTVPTRKGLYGLMLGLCGDAQDAEFLAGIIREQPEDSRMGIDGIMAGYMLITGDAGLARLTEWKIDASATPDHEVYALFKALQFMWSYGRDHVDGQKLKLTHRQLLQRPQLTAVVILDLSRWQDWEVMDQLVASYGQEPFADSQPRHNIIRFLKVAEKDALPAADSPGAVDYSLKAREHLAKLREKDPATFRYIEKFPLD